MVQRKQGKASVDVKPFQMMLITSEHNLVTIPVTLLLFALDFVAFA